MKKKILKKKSLSLVAPPSGKFKGYNSNQSEFRIVITFKAAKPMAVRILVVCKHACKEETQFVHKTKRDGKIHMIATKSKSL